MGREAESCDFSSTNWWKYNSAPSKTPHYLNGICANFINTKGWLKIYFFIDDSHIERERENLRVTVLWITLPTVYPKKYAHGFCFAVLCCGYTLTDFPISIRLTSLALWQSNDCPSASKATLMNMDKYFMWIHYERLHNHNKAKHNKTVCIFLGTYCIWDVFAISGNWLSPDQHLAIALIHGCQHKFLMFTFMNFIFEKCSPWANHTKLASMSAVYTNMYKLRWISKMDKMEWFSTRNNH